MRKLVNSLIVLMTGIIILGSGAMALPQQSPVMPLYFMAGTVTSLETGSLVPNRTVYFCRDMNDFTTNQYITAETNASGRYELNAFEYSMKYGVDLLVGSEGLLIIPPVVGKAANGTKEVITLSADDYTIKNLITINGGGQDVGTIRVTVQNEALALITNATVSITSAQVTDSPSGIYTIENVIPGNYQVHATGTGYIPNSASVIVKKNTITEVTITLSALPAGHGVFWGYVRDDETKIGLGTATVEALSHNRYLTASEIDGWYQQVVAQDTAYKLTTVLYGYQIAEKTPLVDIAEYESKQEDFALLADPAINWGNIGGFVRSEANSNAISGATVQMDNRRMKAISLSDGSYKLLHLPVNNYDVTAYANNYYPQSVLGIPVEKDKTTPRDFSLTDLPAGIAVVLGNVQSNTSLGLSGAQVNITGPASYSAQSDDKGNYSIMNISTFGNYTMAASYTGYDPQSRNESFAEGDVKSVNFTLSPPEGAIPLTITRQGSDILVKWDAVYGIPQLYALTGNGDGVYTDTIGQWTGPLPVSGTIGETNYDIEVGKMTHYTQVGGGVAEVYYKALQSGVPSTILANAKAVGKVNVSLARNGGIWLAGLPLNAGKVSEVFINQIPTGLTVTLLPQNGVGSSGLDYVTASRTSVVGNDFNIEPTVGFWMRNSSPTTDLIITFCGSLLTEDKGKDIAAYDFLGNPLAKDIPTVNIGDNGDKILPQAGTSSGLDYFVKTGNSWGPNLTTLKFDKGFWYVYGADKRKWDIKPSTQTVEIKRITQ